MLRQPYALFRIYLRDCFAYPAASFIWVLADVQAALVLPAVWLASAGPGGQIAGMSHGDLVAYYLCSMTLAQFVICHLMWDIAIDIKEGFFSAQILRPYAFFTTTAARNLSWRIAKLLLFLPILPLVFFAYGGVRGVELHAGWTFWASVLLAHTLSFLAAYCLSMVTLWTTEFISIFRLYYVPEMILSGRLLPLQTLPPWAQDLAELLHFPYMVAFPTNLLLGEVSGAEAVRGLTMQITWCAFFALLGLVLFRRGMRQYTGVGM